MSSPKLGQLAPRDERFVPYAAISKWPYKHLHGEVSKVIADNFFARGAFVERGWNIYYIRTLLDSVDRPLLLISKTEVEGLFKDINQQLNTQVGFPDVYRDPGFCLDFLGEGTPRPRYLGRLSIDCIMADLEAKIPAQGSSLEEPETLDDRSFPSFQQKMQAALLASKTKSKVDQDKRRKDRVKNKKGLYSELKRSQCYLGLRPRGTAQLSNFVTSPNMTQEESQRAQEAYEVAAGIRLPCLDSSIKAPYQFDRDVVFVCIDIEVYERNPRRLTEIGVCTLDTLDLIDLAPGKGGKTWMDLLRCRHFRIAENAHLTNKDFVTGCPDRFELGESEWISVKDAPQVLSSCFKFPFSEPGQYAPYPSKIQQLPPAGMVMPPRIVEHSSNERNVVLVGHNIRSDIDYMRSFGYDVGNLTNLIEAIDTSNLFRAFKHEQNPRSLGSVLLEFELTGWNLHNAGNDAGYTMQAFIAIALAALSTTNEQSTVPTPEQLDEAASKAQSRLKDEMAEWEAAIEEGGDGGDPIKILPAIQAVALQEFERGMRRGQQADKKREIRMAKDWRNTGKTGGPSQSNSSDDRDKNISKKSNPHPAGPLPFDMDAVDEGMGTAHPSAKSDGNTGFYRGDQADVIAPQKTRGNTRDVDRKAGNSDRRNVHRQDEGEALSTNRKSSGQQADVNGLSQKMSQRLQMLDRNWK